MCGPAYRALEARTSSVDARSSSSTSRSEESVSQVAMIRPTNDTERLVDLSLSDRIPNLVGSGAGTLAAEPLGKHEVPRRWAL